MSDNIIPPPRTRGQKVEDWFGDKLRAKIRFKKYIRNIDYNNMLHYIKTRKRMQRIQNKAKSNQYEFANSSIKLPKKYSKLSKRYKYIFSTYKPYMTYDQYLKLKYALKQRKMELNSKTKPKNQIPTVQNIISQVLPIYKKQSPKQPLKIMPLSRYKSIKRSFK